MPESKVWGTTEHKEVVTGEQDDWRESGLNPHYQSVVPGPVAASASGDLGEMQTFRSTESESIFTR